MKGFLQGASAAQNKFPGFHSILQGMPAPASSSTKCTGYVNYTTAPENQFAAVRKTWDTRMGYHRNTDWGWPGSNVIAKSNAAESAMIHGAEERTAAATRHRHTWPFSSRSTSSSWRKCRPAPTAPWPAPPKSPTPTPHGPGHGRLLPRPANSRDPSTGQLNKVSSSYNQPGSTPPAKPPTRPTTQRQPQRHPPGNCPSRTSARDGSQ